MKVNNFVDIRHSFLAGITRLVDQTESIAAYKNIDLFVIGSVRLVVDVAATGLIFVNDSIQANDRLHTIYTSATKKMLLILGRRRGAPC